MYIYIYIHTYMYIYKRGCGLGFMLLVSNSCAGALLRFEVPRNKISFLAGDGPLKGHTGLRLGVLLPGSRNLHDKAKQGFVGSGFLRCWGC